MDRLMGVVVKFAKKVKDGTYKDGGGDWTLWNFTITAADWDGIWFSWFSGGTKPIPAVGMKLDVLEYEVVDKDGYTNYNAKKLLVPEGSAPAANPKPKPRQQTQTGKPAPSGNGGQAYINHGQVVVEMIKLASSPTGKVDRSAYEKILNAFKFGIRVLISEGPPPAPKAETEPEPEPEPTPIEDDDIPF